MHILVTGGCGYHGSVLVPKLLERGYQVTVVDTQWFGNYLQPHPHLEVHKADILSYAVPKGTQAVIHLAGVANDPTGDLNPGITWNVNALGTMQLVDQSARLGVGQFIYASSGSVYGVSDAPEVTENLPLVPISEYNKTKMVAERVLLSYYNRMAVQIIRPATTCGYSPRMRLDVLVNNITMGALAQSVVKFYGGEQMRPNIHIDDLTDLYIFMLERPELTGIYNAGFENLKVKEVAQMVIDKVRCRTVRFPSTDPRSYRLNSDKLLATGFKPKKTVNTAIDELIEKITKNMLSDEDRWYNLKVMPR